MKIDIRTHFLSPAYVRHLEAGAPGGSWALARRQLANRALHDLDRRFAVMDRFGDYRQVLTPLPGPAVYAGLESEAVADLVRGNTRADGRDGVPTLRPLRWLRRRDPAWRSGCGGRGSGPCGPRPWRRWDSVEEDAVGFPLHEDRYDPLFAAMGRLDAAVLLHSFRSPATPGLAKETAPFLLWQVFGWPIDTTITVFRLIFAGLYDRHPRIKLVAHHGGGLILTFPGALR